VGDERPPEIDGLAGRPAQAHLDRAGHLYRA
jgi:hypothetical protein